jgi:hypothetical protein
MNTYRKIIVLIIIGLFIGASFVLTINSDSVYKEIED